MASKDNKGRRQGWRQEGSAEGRGQGCEQESKKGGKSGQPRQASRLHQAFARG